METTRQERPGFLPHLSPASLTLTRPQAHLITSPLSLPTGGTTVLQAQGSPGEQLLRQPGCQEVSAQLPEGRTSVLWLHERTWRLLGVRNTCECGLKGARGARNSQ